MNRDQQNIKHIEGRIASLNINKPEGWQPTVAYLQMAHTDLMSQLTVDEIAEIRASQNRVVSAEEQKVARAREVAELNQNKDKNSI